MVELRKPIIRHRKVVSQGGSHYIAIPPDWFDAHGLDPDDLELLLVANKDIRIVNPVHEEEVYKEVTEIARNVR